MTDNYDLAQYSERQQGILEKCDRYGIDKTGLLNPNLKILEQSYLYDLNKYGIQIEDKHLTNMDHTTYMCYLMNGYRKHDLDSKLLPRLVALYEKLNIPYTTEDGMVEMHKKRFRSEINYTELHQDMKNKYTPDSTYYSESHYLIYDYLRHMVVKERGLDDFLIQYEYEWNDLIADLVFYECPNLKDVLIGLERIRKQTYDIKHMLNSCVEEFRTTGKIDIMIDDKYTINEKMTIQHVYKEYGIDLRVTDLDISNIANEWLWLNPQGKGLSELIEEGLTAE